MEESALSEGPSRAEKLPPSQCPPRGRDGRQDRRGRGEALCVCVCMCDTRVCRARAQPGQDSQLVLGRQARDTLKSQRLPRPVARAPPCPTSHLFTAAGQRPRRTRDTRGRDPGAPRQQGQQRPRAAEPAQSACPAAPLRGTLGLSFLNTWGGAAGQNHPGTRRQGGQTRPRVQRLKAVR